MPGHRIRASLKSFLKGAASLLFAIAGLSFLFGGKAIQIFGGIDRLFAEIIGIGIAFLCLILGVVGKYKIDDIEWQEQNEEAEKSNNLWEGK